MLWMLAGIGVLHIALTVQITASRHRKERLQLAAQAEKYARKCAILAGLLDDTQYKGKYDAIVAERMAERCRTDDEKSDLGRKKRGEY